MLPKGRRWYWLPRAPEQPHAGDGGAAGGHGPRGPGAAWAPTVRGGGQERGRRGTRGSSVPLKDAATVQHPSSGPLSQIERYSALPG